MGDKEDKDGPAWSRQCRRAFYMLQLYEKTLSYSKLTINYVVHTSGEFLTVLHHGVRIIILLCQ